MGHLHWGSCKHVSGEYIIHWVLHLGGHKGVRFTETMQGYLVWVHEGV